jgi:uncharacterized protein YjdB/beta-N-acetylglucosaminidase
MKIFKNNRLGDDIIVEKNTLAKKVLAMFSIIVISMPSFYNIANATITTGLPVSTVDEIFPDSYKPYLNLLKSEHPNWTFKALHTGLDWTESVRQESYEVKAGISTVPKSYSSNWKQDKIDHFIDGSFVAASKEAVAYTLDPRNFLNDSGIFQFEALDYNSETSTEATINKVISDKVMSSYPTQYKRSGSMVNLENGLNWAQVISNAAKNCGGNGISGVFFASRMKQETSLDILNNGSINGSNDVYPGVYNFFNIGATPSSVGADDSVINGLAYASSKGWTTPAASINAGATYLWKNYIQWGQNTIYFQKFDVANPYGNATMLYGSQYMTNILAPSSEAQITYSAYLNAGLLNSSFVFYIPVYDNMPNTVSPHPDSEDNSSTAVGTDIIYLDDTTDSYPYQDTFYIRSGKSTDYSSVATIVETADVTPTSNTRKKFVRIEKGTDGWDKILLDDGTEGYVSQSYVKDYIYTHVSGVALDKSTASLKVGETTTLTPTIAPTDAYIRNVSWSSNNTGVVTIDSNGKVTAVGVGAATIFVNTLDGNKTASCVITVSPTIATSITVPTAEYSIVVGNYLNLEPTVLPSTTTDKSYNITVLDTSIATVENGKIKGLKNGNTTVTLTTKDGSNKSCTFTLKVVDNVAIVNSKLSVNNAGVITKVALSSKVSEIKSNITTSYTTKLVSPSGTTLNDTDIVGTGTKVQILNGSTLLQEYTIAVYGDVNSDTKITSGDYVYIKNYIMTTKSLSDIEKISADYNNDGKVSSSDYVLIKNYIMSH